jgi:16S rRNA G1207 methylase RsmC
MGAPDGLEPSNSGADPGQRLLADAVAREASEGLLLVHCGDLPGLRPGATRLILDVREHTGSMHRCVPVGLDRDPLEGRSFAAALCWPRAHLGIDFSRANLAYGATHLRPGGVLWCAARRQKGGKRLAATMQDLLGNVEVRARDRGYHLYASSRGDAIDAELARELLGVEYEITDPRLGDASLRSVPGVFSRKQLDAGTAVLLDHAASRAGDDVRNVIDLGCGLGALAVWACRRWPEGRVLAVDTNLLAVALTRVNVERVGAGARVQVEAADGLGALESSAFSGTTDLVLCNPPTHAPAESLAALLGEIARWLAPGGRAMVVVNRPGRATQALTGAGLEVRAFDRGNYHVLEATRG